jgi:hypothetical protein
MILPSHQPNEAINVANLLFAPSVKPEHNLNQCFGLVQLPNFNQIVLFI